MQKFSLHSGNIIHSSTAWFIFRARNLSPYLFSFALFNCRIPLNHFFFLSFDRGSQWLLLHTPTIGQSSWIRRGSGSIIAMRETCLPFIKASNGLEFPTGTSQARLTPSRSSLAWPFSVPCSHIILMVADDMACDARNPRPGTVYSSAYNPINMYGEDVEVDYRGYEVTVENFIRVLTGRLHPATPPSKRLRSDERSNIFLYMTGARW